MHEADFCTSTHVRHTWQRAHVGRIMYCMETAYLVCSRLALICCHRSISALDMSLHHSHERPGSDTLTGEAAEDRTAKVQALFLRLAATGHGVESVRLPCRRGLLEVKVTDSRTPQDDIDGRLCHVDSTITCAMAWEPQTLKTGGLDHYKRARNKHTYYFTDRNYTCIAQNAARARHRFVSWRDLNGSRPATVQEARDEPARLPKAVDFT